MSLTGLHQSEERASKVFLQKHHAHKYYSKGLWPLIKDRYEQSKRTVKIMGQRSFLPELKSLFLVIEGFYSRDMTETRVTFRKR